MNPTNFVWLFAAGGLGALARYLLAGTIQRWAGESFPLGTLVVNVAGCLLFGIIAALASERQAISEETRLLFLVGFMGSFTTFSTLAFETGTMLQESQWLSAAVNLVAHNLLGILALFVGMALAKWI